jgi:ankyrin repeat protein
MYNKLLSLILLSAPLIASEKNLLKNSSLILAIQQNDEKQVENLLQRDANPNSEDEHGNHTIHLAMEWDTEQENPFYKKRKFLPHIVKLLLKHNANPNAPYRLKKATPLHAAVFHNSPEIVIELIYYGAKKDACDARGVTPLQLARSYKYHDIVSILSTNVPPLPVFAIEKEIESFHLIEIKKTPFTIDTSKPFSTKNIIDNYITF